MRCGLFQLEWERIFTKENGTNRKVRVIPIAYTSWVTEAIVICWDELGHSRIRAGSLIEVSVSINIIIFMSQATLWYIMKEAGIMPKIHGNSSD